MIKYRLVCEESHEFEAWFRNSEAFDNQVVKQLLSCPQCSSTVISKAIMAPNVSTGSGDSPGQRELETEKTDQVQASVRRLREAVAANAEYVGPEFADEARKIHNDEAPERGIYGEASADEVEALVDDGIPVLPLPRLREDLN
jgi:hypothetical protein